MKTWGIGDEVLNNPLNPNLNSIESYDGTDGINQYSLARAIRNLVDNDTELFNYIATGPLLGEGVGLIYPNSFGVTATSNSFINNVSIGASIGNFALNFSGSFANI